VNEVSLNNADFDNGKLSLSGYIRLKKQCEYIRYNSDVEIKMPQEYAENFKDTFECFVANELLYIKKKRRNAKIIALTLLMVGVLWYLVRHFFISSIIAQEITLVATWVFVWAAVEKLFFDQNILIKRRRRLFQLLSAKIIEK